MEAFDKRVLRRRLNSLGWRPEHKNACLKVIGEFYTADDDKTVAVLCEVISSVHQPNQFRRKIALYKFVFVTGKQNTMFCSVRL
jgi:hypothetical protein